jgi:2-keto-4-pentenoate hydratase/2-oxohepta-3-ene-1,7-dioic acid hydratase in catechol pathway
VSQDGLGRPRVWLVTADEIPDPRTVDLGHFVNSEERQWSDISDIIFPVAQIVA